MTPELIEAIKERIVLGLSREEIEAEVIGTGYTKEQFAEAYDLATNNTNPVATDALVVSSLSANFNESGKLISVGELLSKMWELMKMQVGALGKTFGVSILFLIGFFLLGGLAFLYSEELSSQLIIPIFIVSYLIFTFVLSLLYAVMMRTIIKRTDNGSYFGHLKWVTKQILPLSGLAILMMGIVLTGYLFLIIPGIMLIIYLSMTLNFALDGRLKGLDALILSTKYTYGRFWAIFGRLLVVGLVMGLLTFVFMMIGAFTLFLIPLFFLLAIFVSYYGIACAWIVLYESLLATGPKKPLPVSDSTLKNIYLVAGIVGIFLYLGVTLATLPEYLNLFP
jgi:hypothetical protein